MKTVTINTAFHNLKLCHHLFQVVLPTLKDSFYFAPNATGLQSETTGRINYMELNKNDLGTDH